MSENNISRDKFIMVICGLIIGFVIAAVYYFPAYTDMKDQCNEYRIDSHNAIRSYDELQSQVEPLNTELKRKTIEYDDLRVEYNSLNSDYRSIKSSYNQLNNEYSSLVNEYNDQVTVLNNVKTLSSQQQQQLDRVSGLMQDSYNRGYNDASMGGSDGISDLLGLLTLFMI